MADTSGNKHADRSAKTRLRFVEAAEKLFASRGIDSVSLNEITVAAGQKNRNALQYHFGSREGLLQAIIDRHAGRIHELRRDYFDNLADDAGDPCRAAARGLVLPVARYIEQDPSGAFYVKILSQLAALNSDIINPATRSGLSFQSEKLLADYMGQAVAHLSRTEAQRRFFLTVSFTFHGLADACRAAEADNVAATLTQRGEMFEQVALAVEAFLRAPASDH